MNRAKRIMLKHCLPFMTPKRAYQEVQQWWKQLSRRQQRSKNNAATRKDENDKTN